MPFVAPEAATTFCDHNLSRTRPGGGGLRLCISQEVHNIIGKLHVCQKRCLCVSLYFFSFGNKKSVTIHERRKNNFRVWKEVWFLMRSNIRVKSGNCSVMLMPLEPWGQYTQLFSEWLLGISLIHRENKKQQIRSSGSFKHPLDYHFICVGLVAVLALLKAPDCVIVHVRVCVCV